MEDPQFIYTYRGVYKCVRCVHLRLKTAPSGHVLALSSEIFPNLYKCSDTKAMGCFVDVV